MEARVAALERRALAVQTNVARAQLTERERRVVDAAANAELLGSAVVRVPSTYYQIPLARRAELLNCPPQHLCKTIVLENAAGTVVGDPSQPLHQQRYLAVVVQYVAKLSMDVVTKFVGAPSRLTLAPLDAASSLTGFGLNGMTIVGVPTPFPVIVARDVARLPFIWLGGGEVDAKLRLFTAQLLEDGKAGRAMGAGANRRVIHVVDCSEPRDGDDVDGGAEADAA
jgi:prolyl-tRNA editing enzyme YbaK/EbsC (Cys-tRNA(Pro) deacylase)